MDINDALRLIIAQCPGVTDPAIRALRIAQRDSVTALERSPVRYAIEAALEDPQSMLSPEQRNGLAALLLHNAANDEDTRTETLRFRVTPRERRIIEAMADAEGLDVSGLIRARLKL